MKRIQPSMALGSLSDNLKSKIRNPKWGWSIAITVTLALCGALAQAQQQTKVYRIGFLATISFSAVSARTNAFQQGMRDLGYVEGKSIVIEWRSAEGNFDRLADLAAELVRFKLDVIVTAAPPAARAAKGATTTIPIVMAFDDDPVDNGFVASLA
jgi:putative ABC transport system substrate-binding protein